MLVFVIRMCLAFARTHNSPPCNVINICVSISRCIHMHNTLIPCIFSCVFSDEKSLWLPARLLPSVRVYTNQYNCHYIECLSIPVDSCAPEEISPVNYMKFYLWRLPAFVYLRGEWRAFWNYGYWIVGGLGKAISAGNRDRGLASSGSGVIQWNYAWRVDCFIQSTIVYYKEV